MTEATKLFSIDLNSLSRSTMKDKKYEYFLLINYKHTFVCLGKVKKVIYRVVTVGY